MCVCAIFILKKIVYKFEFKFIASGHWQTINLFRRCSTSVVYFPVRSVILTCTVNPRYGIIYLRLHVCTDFGVHKFKFEPCSVRCRRCVLKISSSQIPLRAISVTFIIILLSSLVPSSLCTAFAQTILKCVKTKTSHAPPAYRRIRAANHNTN